MKQGDKAMPPFDYQAALLRDIGLAMSGPVYEDHFKSMVEQQRKDKAMKKAKGKGKGGGKC